MTAEFVRNSRQQRSSIPTSHDSFVPVSPACTMSILFERTLLMRINTRDGAGCSGSSPDAQRRFERADETPFQALAGTYSYPIRSNYRLLGGFPWQLSPVPTMAVTS